ncbi:MAG: ribosome biosis GTPase / thiamine phosphate phosphatase [Thermotogaceae bacterium]|nr:ribosome biosis GTPase / thiamine phosphate phosphatase [Thermotogaceae bacterium]MDN5338252.1 ribosome biosis GTPase / thiamine phosphate phosphatase [Thermotogaceae bacterium]
MRFHSNMATVEDWETGKRYICKLRGKFKLQNIRPIVGDIVEYIPDSNDSGRIESILHRKNELKKPRIANVDQVVLVTTLKQPEVSLKMVDRFLILAEKALLPTVIVFNKIDLLDSKELETLEEISSIYSRYYRVLKTSVKKEIGLEELKEVLKDKISTMAGLSGVGKSSLLNSISPGVKLKVGELSEKLERGKHTTTHAELLRLEFGGYVADTPGFANLDISDIKPEELKELFPEFSEVESCVFPDCVHINEPGCSVKQAVGIFIPESRYESYADFYMELSENQ